MPTGTLKMFKEQKGYGFIHPEDGGIEIFVHIKDISPRSGISPKPGDRFTYEVGEGKEGRACAKNVVRL